MRRSRTNWSSDRLKGNPWSSVLTHGNLGSFTCSPVVWPGLIKSYICKGTVWDRTSLTDSRQFFFVLIIRNSSMLLCGYSVAFKNRLKTLIVSKWYLIIKSDCFQFISLDNFNNILRGPYFLDNIKAMHGLFGNEGITNRLRRGDDGDGRLVAFVPQKSVK